MHLRRQIATCFGRHSRRVWRCIIGATWSLPLRYITLAAQLAAIATLPGVSMHLPAHGLVQALSMGVAIGWAASLADRLAVEYCLFPALRRFFVGQAL
jgi:hypothetical protein